MTINRFKTKEAVFYLEGNFMTPEQYKKVRDLKEVLLPPNHSTPTNLSCTIEALGKDRVEDQTCYRKDSACALCMAAGVTCGFVMDLVTIHDGLAPIGRKFDSMRGDGPGFAG